VVIEGRGVGPTLDEESVAVLIDLIGGDPRAKELARETKHLGGDPTGVTHALDHVVALHDRFVPTFHDTGIGVTRTLDVIGHAAHR
jgi:hypothetical protein